MVPKARVVRAFVQDASRRCWAKLRAFRNRRFDPRLRHDPGGPYLVLSPHLDDAVIDCWSVLTDSGDVRVVNIFAGVPSPGRWCHLLLPAGGGVRLGGPRRRADRG